jgi:hypothetical protein
LQAEGLLRNYFELSLSYIIMKRAILIFLLLFPVLSMAAPWCRVLDTSEICRFELAEDCYQAARFGGGYCRPNSKEAGVGGVARWCIVTATSKKCIHRFRTRCMNDARQIEGAGCVENIDLALQSKRMRRGSAGGEGACEDIACEMREAGIEQGGPPPSQ